MLISKKPDVTKKKTARAEAPPTSRRIAAAH